MKTRLFLLFLGLCSLGFQSLAQWGNSWINYGQPYVKIITDQDDIYRISHADLVAAGFPAEVSPNDLRMFHRGEQVAIFIEDGGNGEFDEDTDYVEFYGRRNDGISDVELFNRPRDQIHQYYNLFSDETAFFLTIDTGGQAGLRMSSSNEPGTGLTANTSHQQELLEVYTSKFSFGQFYPIGNPFGESKLSLYDAGQMFVGDSIMRNEFTLRSGKTFRDLRIDGLELAEQNDGKPNLEVQIVGFNNRPHNVAIHVGPDTENMRLIKADLLFNFSNFINPSSQIEWTDVSPQGRLIVRVEVVGLPDIPDDRVAVSYIKVDFPQQTDMQSADQKFFYLPASTSNQLLDIQNVLGDVAVYDVTDYRRPIRLSHTVAGNNINTVVAASAAPRKIMVRRVDGSGGIANKPVEQMDFKLDLDFVRNKNFMIISHEYLRTCNDCEYADPVQAYIDYRSSVEGGGHRVLYTDVSDIFNEFNYGEFSPLGIRRFVDYVYNAGNLRAESDAYLFLIGKSRRVDNAIQRLSNPLATRWKDLVPTMGAPGSDILFTEGLSGVRHFPAFPVGRLSVSEPQNVGYYLNKVKEKEASLKDSPWTKNFIQLSGGLTTSELLRFRGLIDQFKGKVEGDFLGANVTNLSKQTNNVVQKFNISEDINRGIGFVTFFGHSSSTFTDIDIGEVTDPSNGYDNQGRYPVFLVNGCRGGEIFRRTSFGENWLAAEGKGAVNFMAHSDVGISTVLADYTNAVYELMADTLWMTRSIGHIQQQAIANFLNTPFLDELRSTTAEQTILQGDPSIPIFGHDKVDYIVRPEDIFLRSLDGNDITAATPFFELGVVVNNGGRTTTSPLVVQVNRRLEDGTVFNLPAIEVDPIRFRDTVFYQLSNQGIDVFGDNSFEVLIDPDNLVEEGSEINNMAERTFNFPANGTFNTSPANFALINQARQNLVVQSANLRLNDKVFIVELDTVNTFDSPWMQRTTLTGKGIATWDVSLLPISFRDTVQYYWRSVFQDQSMEEEVPWANNTFTFIRNGVEGWGQTDFDQFEELNLSSVSKSPSVDEEWIFAGSTTDLRVVTYGTEHPTDANNVRSVAVDIDRNPQIPGNPCGLNTLNAVAFDKDSGQPYFVLATPNTQDPLDPLKCGREPSIINSIPEANLANLDIELSESLIRQYVDGVNEGDSVLVFSVGELSYDWPSNVTDDLQRIGIGISVINSLQTGEPFIAFGAKGAPAGSARVVLGEIAGNQDNARPARIEFNTTIIASTDSGTVQTPVIGPASQWGTLTKRIREQPGEDIVTFEVRGVMQDGTTNVLFPSVTMDELDLSSVDPSVYPFIRLFVNMEDPISATPAQLEEWVVTFDGVPEGIVSLQNEENRGVELMEGQPFEVEFKFTNISAYDFPQELDVQYTFTNQITGNSEMETTTIPAVAAGQEETFMLTIPTQGRIGLNDLEVFVNPGGAVVEQFDANNIIRLESFYNVLRDEINPNLDVTFDGVYILNGDIISPTPQIVVELRDNNPFLFKTDAAGVEIRLGSACDGCTLETIDLNGPEVELIPADENQNFRLEFSPNFLDEALGDGVYRLEVEVPDASGNQSGIGPYTVDFEVVTVSSVTHFFPYPNPFSTSTRFVFTLTGSEVPDQLKIQIFTVSGKLVREITQAEIGPIRIGQNITQYAWDGRDEFGDLLANGTYLYRVQLRSTNGTDFSRRGTSKDGAFDNGFGKLVIIR